jgi:long-chain fatty acid transport protein
MGNTLLRPIAVLIGIAAPLCLRGQGFALNEIGSCAVARGFAVSAAPCRDASTIFWNPAATLRLGGFTLYGGLAAIQVNGSFEQDTTGRKHNGDVPTAFPPHLFLNYSRVDRWGLGLGVYVPYGLTSQWKQDFPGRFTAQKASLQTIYVQPNVSFALTDTWSIGGGPVFAHSSIELRQGLDLSQQSPLPGITFGQLGISAGTEFARAHLEGSTTGWGFNVGLHGKLSQSWSLGGRFLSSITLDYDDADAEFTQVATGLVLPQGNPISDDPLPLDPLLAAQFTGSGTLTPQKVGTRVTHPWQAQVGLNYSSREGSEISIDVRRIGWSGFKELPIEFQGNAATSNRTLIEDYEDSWSVHIGGAYRITQLGAVNGWEVRGGYGFVQSPAPDVTVTPLLPDQNRHNVAIGVGIPLSPGLSLDATYLNVSSRGRRGRIAERASLDQTAEQLNSGVYRLGASVGSISLKYHF